MIKDNKELKFCRGSRWADKRHLQYQQIPSAYRQAILSRDSLTSRMKGACDGDFSVSLVSQSWGRPLFEEWQALGLKRGEQAIIREVRLQCSGVSWVFARSVVPAETFQNYRRLSQLGERPLGELLFKERTMRRGEMELARLRRGHILYHHAGNAVEYDVGEVLWGRRSLFHVQGCPLLVCEIFLPAYGGESCLSS